MKKLLTLFVIVGGLLICGQVTHAGTGCLAGTGTSCNTTTQVRLQITPGNICIGSTGVFNLWSLTASSSPQTTVVSFTGSTGYFFVDDLKGSNSGYYTTVQISGALYQSGGSGTIPATSIYMRTSATWTGWVTLLAWVSNPRVEIRTGMATFQTLNVARRLIQRPNATNFGIVGKYGVLPQIQLTVPPFQAVGSYYGTLVYTLYEN